MRWWWAVFCCVLHARAALADGGLPVRPPTASLRELSEVPTLHVDGRPRALTAFAAPSGARALAGTDFSSFPVSGDLGAVDERMKALLEGAPRTLVVPRVLLPAPPQREDAAAGLRRLIRHVLEQPYAANVVGYHLDVASPTEANRREPAMTAAYRRWLSRRYGQDVGRLRSAWSAPTATFETATLPRADETRAVPTALLDPTRHQALLDAALFEAEIEAETRESLGRVVREETRGRAFSVVTYGALLASPDKRQLALGRLLRSPHVDLVGAPHPTSFSQPGSGVSTHAGPARSAALARKLWWSGEPLPTPVGVALRDLGLRLATGTAGLWLGARGVEPDGKVVARVSALEERAVHADRRSTAEIAAVVDETSLRHFAEAGGLWGPLVDAQRVELARVGAPVDVILLDDLDRAPAYRLYLFLGTVHTSDAQRRAIARLPGRGAKALVWVYAGDVIDKGITTSRTADTLGFALRRVDEPRPLEVRPKQAGLVTALGGVPELHRFGTEASIAPYFVVDDASVEVLGELFGTNQPGLVRKRWGDDSWTYHSVAPRVSAPVLRAIARDAGVHLYVEGDDALTAGASFVSLHASSSGRKTIRLPQATDVFDPAARKVVGRGVDTITFDLEAQETGLFFLGSEDAWQTLHLGQPSRTQPTEARLVPAQ